MELINEILKGEPGFTWQNGAGNLLLRHLALSVRVDARITSPKSSNKSM